MGVGFAAAAVCVGTAVVGCVVVGGVLLGAGIHSTTTTLADPNVSEHDKWARLLGRPPSRAPSARAADPPAWRIVYVDYLCCKWQTAGSDLAVPFSSPSTDGEGAISRERTMWMAKRAEPLDLPRP